MDEVLIQEYVGREVSVGFMGWDICPFSRSCSTGCRRAPGRSSRGQVGHRQRRDLGTQPVCPAVLTSELNRRAGPDPLAGDGRLPHRLKGYGRVDLQVTEQGEVYVLEVNPNPDLSMDAGRRGWVWPGRLQLILESWKSGERFEQANAAESPTQHVPAMARPAWVPWIGPSPAPIELASRR